MDNSSVRALLARQLSNGARTGDMVIRVSLRMNLFGLLAIELSSRAQFAALLPTPQRQIQRLRD